MRPSKKGGLVSIELAKSVWGFSLCPSALKYIHWESLAPRTRMVAWHRPSPVKFRKSRCQWIVWLLLQLTAAYSGQAARFSQQGRMRHHLSRLSAVPWPRSAASLQTQSSAAEVCSLASSYQWVCLVWQKFTAINWFRYHPWKVFFRSSEFQQSHTPRTIYPRLYRKAVTGTESLAGGSLS